MRHILRQATSQGGENPQTRHATLVTETETRGRNPAARSLSDKALLSSQRGVPNFEYLQFSNQEPREEREDDAAVVDYVEEQHDVEEPQRIGVTV